MNPSPVPITYSRRSRVPDVPSDRERATAAQRKRIEMIREIRELGDALAEPWDDEEEAKT